MTIGRTPPANGHRAGAGRRVLIAGAGLAALEALLALRRFAGLRVEVDMVAPGESFLYRPVSVADCAYAASSRAPDLTAILADQHVSRHVDTLASVDSELRIAHTGTGAQIRYDELIIAHGARPVPVVRGALAFRGRQDVAALRAVLDDLDRGRISRIAFVLPPTNAWPVPMYELALAVGARIRARNLNARALLVSAEPEPLALFGGEASAAIADLLRAQHIELEFGAVAREFAGGVLQLACGRTLDADRVVALPRLVGPAVPGLSDDGTGFIPIDEHGCVRDVDHVHAAGDATASPYKQGGLAAAQADAIAEQIAVGEGTTIVPRVFPTGVRGLLLIGDMPIYARVIPAVEADFAEPAAGDSRLQRTPRGGWPVDPVWWPPSELLGRFLAPYLTGARERSDRGGMPPRSRPSRRERADTLALSSLLAEHDANVGDHAMAVNALDCAESLTGPLPAYLADRRTRWGELAGRAAESRA